MVRLGVKISLNCTARGDTLLYRKVQVVLYRKVQVGKDQEKAQSEKDSHSKNRGGNSKTEVIHRVSMKL